MTGPIAYSLATQLLLLAGAKWRTREERQSTLLGSLTSGWGRSLWPAAIVIDVLIAASLGWRQSARVAAAMLIVLAALGTAVELAVRRDLPCGCFGAAQSRARRGQRERAARLLLAAESAIILVGAGVDTLPQVATGLALLFVLALLVPEVITAWSPAPPLTRVEAVRVLAAAPELGPWRPYLLSDIPAIVTLTGRQSAEVVLDAWSDSGPILLVGRIHGRRAEIIARDGRTLERLGRS